MKAIEIKQLDFGYKKKEAILEGLNMNIPQACIYGFLGPNGAGKTTTLKLILNLLKNRSQGTITVLGNHISNHYPAYLNNIGSLIEQASIYGHLSAKDNLKIWSNYHNCSSHRCDEVLEIIGLDRDSKKKARDFSTGMKQRLGIGISIMHDPEILILDEPTNGLDPMGIESLRKLMQNLKEQGKTILLSSHILTEVEKIVDQVGIIKNGNLVFEGTLDQLNGLTLLSSNITVAVDDSEKAKMILSIQYPTIMDGDKLSIEIKSKDDINHIARMILDNGLKLYEINFPKKDLETIFMKLAK